MKNRSNLTHVMPPQRLRIMRRTTASVSTAGGRMALCLFSSLIFAGCGMDLPVDGMRPIHPAMKVGTLSSPQPVRQGYPIVNHRNLVLRWEPFSPPEGAFTGPSRVRYDLRIWLVGDYGRGDLVYEKMDLPNPWHRVEGALRPGTRYFWSVRARIRLNGEVRLTDWSRLAGPDFPFGRKNLRDDIPVVSYYRFWTGNYGDDSFRHRFSDDDW